MNLSKLRLLIGLNSQTKLHTSQTNTKSISETTAQTKKPYRLNKNNGKIRNVLKENFSYTMSE